MAAAAALDSTAHNARHVVALAKALELARPLVMGDYDGRRGRDLGGRAGAWIRRRPRPRGRHRLQPRPPATIAAW